MSKSLHSTLIASSTLALLVIVVAPLPAEDVVQQMDAFRVIGSQEAAFNMPGSGTYIGPEILERFQFSNINDIVRMVPGVYVRDEDGYGLFPHISIRGVDTNRSAKVTMMEDGVLTAPAPYSAPSAYYSPTAGRMSGFEVLKGSSQIQYGPHTTGGVINYISTPIPETNQGYVEGSYGNYDTFNGHLWYGGKKQTEFGTFGALVEIYREQTDGFREIEESANGDYDGSDDTGYDRTDYMVKLNFEPDWSRRNLFELKLGYSELDANETYLGLNPADLNDAPWSRYAASADDNIESEHFRTYLRHLIEFDNKNQLTTTLYYNAFTRDWNKLDKVNGLNPAQVILADPGVLRGETTGNFKIKSNDREYYLYGVQSKYEHNFETVDLQHKLSLGARLHKDNIDRYQDAATYNNVFAGDFDSPAMITGPDDEGDREQETVALALFVQDRIEFGNWAFTPGLRWEYIDWDYIRRDGRTPAEKDSGNYSVFAGGLGFEYALDNPNAKIFGGYHRGFSVPSPGGKKAGNEYDEETSDTFELGYRYDNSSGFYAEAVAFSTLLQDLIVEDSIAGGPGDGNVGDTETLGLELLAGADFGQIFDQSYGIPVRLAFTFTDATLDGDVASEDPESIFGAGEDGKQVPYIPEIQVSFTAGLEFGNFSTYAVVTYVDERYADARNSSQQVNTHGDPDARFGKLDSFVTVDLSASCRLTDNSEVFAKVSNIFEEEYVSSRIPLGPRAGAPRLFSMGLNRRF
jgi:Fe(3+) dicitrate transport protein